MTGAADVIAALRARAATVATAESLTGGLVCATLVDVPGASDVVRGAVVAYAADVKTELLGVSSALIAEHGTVDQVTAAQMARGVRERLLATYGLSTTGVAGPETSEGKSAGTVHIAVAGPTGVRSRALILPGDRAQVRTSTVDAVLSLLLDMVMAA